MLYLTTQGSPVHVRSRAERNGVDRGLWDHHAQADADRDTSQAQAFCDASPEDAAALGNAGTWSVTLDDSAEINFPDGSVASCLNGGPWEPRALNSAECNGPVECGCDCAPGACRAA